MQAPAGGGAGTPAVGVAPVQPTDTGHALSAPKGRVCTSEEQCGTGFCVAGVCCDTACDGTCCTGDSFSGGPTDAPPVCQPKLRDNERCSEDGSCLSGYCARVYRDADGDGYGVAYTSVCAPKDTVPSGYAFKGGDRCDTIRVRTRVSRRTHHGPPPAGTTTGILTGSRRRRRQCRRSAAVAAPVRAVSASASIVVDIPDVHRHVSWRSTADLFHLVRLSLRTRGFERILRQGSVDRG